MQVELVRGRIWTRALRAVDRAAWGAAWRALTTQAVAALAVLLGLFTAEFATWRFVA